MCGVLIFFFFFSWSKYLTEKKEKKKTKNQPKTQTISIIPINVLFLSRPVQSTILCTSRYHLVSAWAQIQKKRISVQSTNNTQKDIPMSDTKKKKTTVQLYSPLLHPCIEKFNCSNSSNQNFTENDTYFKHKKGAVFLFFFVLHQNLQVFTGRTWHTVT